MKRKWITTLTLIGCLAMMGIIIVQFFWIRNALLVNREKFDRSVALALGKICDQLEKKEDLRYLDQHMNLNITTSDEEEAVKPDIKSAKEEQVEAISESDSTIILENFPDFFTLNVDSLLHEFRISARWSGYNFRTETEWEEDSLLTGQQTITVQIPVFKRPPNFPHFPGLIPSPVPPDPFALEWNERIREQKEKEHSEQEATRLNRKVKKMKEVVKQMVVEVETKNQKIENRIDSGLLKTEMNKAFSDAGINIPYEYAVIHPEKDSITSLHSLNFNPAYTQSSFVTTLFPNDLVTRPNRLLVYFPDQRWNIIKSMSLLMGASVIFTLALLVTFLATIFTLLRQKKLSEIKTDFINNMTHEFKTPIATISLATDSIDNPKVIGDPERIQNFTRVIREENQRMNTHVEQVLQMALLDKKEIELNLQSLDVHELLTRTVENILLQIDKKGGSISIDFRADQFIIKADEIHLFNAVLNLLDNANKYSGGIPDIRVFTYNNGPWLVIGVEDKGIGMSREVQKKIFERFYRVHTGDLHNIKGFGLGLSYVNAIVDAHRGKIAVHSEQGKGSIFELKLPLT